MPVPHSALAGPRERDLKLSLSATLGLAFKAHLSPFYCAPNSIIDNVDRCGENEKISGIRQVAVAIGFD